MKGENEFTYFLVGGLIILAALFVIFGFGYSACPQPCPPVQQTPGAVQAVKVFHIPVFSASNLLENRESALISKRIHSGLLFGEDKIIYDLLKSDLQDVTVKFRVVDANRLGRLMVKVNGEILENRMFDPGTYEIEIPGQLVSDHLVIEISAESSFWRIWAPNLYDVAETSVKYTSYSEDSAQFRFYLGEEYTNLQFAKVDVVFTQNAGTLLVDLNGRNVWSSPAANVQSVAFDRANLRLGDNIVRFSAAPNSRFVGNATIVVVFLSQFPETINQSGVITAVQPVFGQALQFYR